jgi:hypothetical protein
MEIQISGKISGLSEAQVKEKFAASEKLLKKEWRCVPVFNPVSEGEKQCQWCDRKKYCYPEMQWNCLMIMCLDNLVNMPDGSILYMQKDWQSSKGARIEHFVAREKGIMIEYEEPVNG